MQPFDANILKILDKVSYEMFVVQQEFDIDCPCVDFTTKQAVDTCPKCLGTGKKIKIRKVKAAVQNNKTSFRAESVGENATTSVYYIKGDRRIYQDNIFVNGDAVDVVLRVEPLRSDSAAPVYYRCEANPKKTSTKAFLSNFHKAVGG